MICAIQYPSWIQPEIIPGFPFLRWYGFMYLVAFTIAFVLFKVQVNKGELQRYAKSEKPITNEDIIDFFTWSLFGLMLGARIFAKQENGRGCKGCRITEVLSAAS